MKAAKRKPIDERALDPSTRIVLAYVRGKQGVPCAESFAYIEERTGISERQVSRAVADLERFGFVTVDRRHRPPVIAATDWALSGASAGGGGSP